MADQTFAVHCGFFDAINSDRTYSADEMNRPYKRVISNGVFATPNGTPSTDLQVTASSGMNIICKKGEGLFGDKWFENPSGIAITVPSNTGTVPRIDSVLVQVDTRTSGRVGNIVHRTGTPASSPVPPAINQTEGVVEYRLANIRVNAGVSAITQSMITDRRGSSDCPWVTSLIYQVDTSTLYDQWAAAYAEYFEEEKAIWDAWYAQLTEDLDVSMTLDRHTNTVTTTAQTTGTIPIGLAYNHNTDILEVYINGLRAVEGTHYVVVNDDTSIQVENQLDTGQAVTFVVMRSVISGSATNIMVLLQELESQIAGIAGGTPTVVDAKADMTEHGKIYILSTDSKWYYYSTTASDWLAGGTYGGVPTDTTLSISGSAADAKAVGDALAEKADSDDVDAIDDRVTALENGSGSGLTADIKAALLACFANVAWANENGQTYYDALDAALNPPANLSSITCVYTQSGTVYDTASLDDLKPDLVVTAHWSDNTTSTVTTYTLSGTLTEGTSTITVSYGGKTATFTVTVSVFSTAPVIAEEGKVWSSTSASSAPVLYNAAGFGVTETYGCTFSQSNLESSGLYDETNDYMTTNGWSGIKYYISDVNTLADGKSWPSSNRSKHTMIKNDAAIVGWNTITKNAEGTWQFSRYISDAAHCDGVSFTIPLLDKDECYAYWHKPIEKAILPDGISEGDIIFAGRNTPYWGCSNISEASS